MELYQHQKDVLNQTEHQNKVAIKGYEGIYEIDNLGNVYSVKHGILKPYLKNGYFAVNLYSKTCKHYYIHRLVAESFIPNPEKLREVNHLDCNKLNNHVSNLEWCNRMRNLKHSYENGLKRCGEKHGMHKLTENEVLQIRNEYVKNSKDKSLHKLADKYGVDWCTIQAIVTGKLWKHLL